MGIKGLEATRFMAGKMRVAALGLAAALALANGAIADESAKGQQIFGQKAGCPFCHGWAGDGRGDAHSDGAAPSLRATTLTRDQIREVIQCGRPGTPMPHFDKFAYTDKRCYGATADDLGNTVPDQPPVGLQAFEIDAVADYVGFKLKGLGEVTYDQCVAFFGASSTCNEYPKK